MTDDTPDERSGSVATLRRNQSQNRFFEGRVCFVIRAVNVLVLNRWIKRVWGLYVLLTLCQSVNHTLLSRGGSRRTR